MNKQVRRVVVTGMGVISPIGNDVNTFWESLKTGKCGIDKVESLDDYVLPVHVAGRVKDFNPLNFGLSAAEKRRNDIYSQYALAATHQALSQSGLVSGENIDESRLGVYIGSGIGGIQTLVQQTKIMFDDGVNRISPLFIPMMIANIAGGNIAIKYKAQGPCLTHVSACATGTNSIGEAYLAIKYGRADAIIAGGSEAAVTPLAIGGFTNAKALTLEEDPTKACLPFDIRRGGFVISEGAGVMVLEEREHALNRGATVLAEVCGYGCTCDAFHYTAPRPDGITSGRAIRQALDEAEYKDGENLYINAHGTGTKLNDSTETLAIKVALGEQEARRASISSSKSMHGHMLGATGTVELIASALALMNSTVPPTLGLEQPDPECDLDYTPLQAKERDLDIAISNSLGFGGHDVCVALRRV